VQAVVTSVQELVLRLQQLEAADGRRPAAMSRGAADDEEERLQGCTPAACCSIRRCACSTMRRRKPPMPLA
jgi:hypothetical protein